MHETSYLKVAFFNRTYVEPYLRDNRSVRVLDVGSRSHAGHSSYKDIFEGEGIDYVGLDLQAGRNVHIVPRNPYRWEEIENEEFDFCISGQSFEHNPFFWITFAEMARVLKQEGMIQVIAPGRGRVHRHPVDCWRFYPDSWQALCDYCGLELIESYFEEYGFRRVLRGSQWCDSCVIARKPRLDGAVKASEFYERIRSIVSTLPASFERSLSTSPNPTGECFDNYNRTNRCSATYSLRRRLRPKHIFRGIFRYL
jgi:SAM-dependent methyltransferase